MADASPVPVLLYNFTNVTGLEHDARHGGGACRRTRTSSASRTRTATSARWPAIVARVPAGVRRLVGSAATLYPSLVVGAAGAIVAVANVVPEVCVRLFDLVRAGKHDEAQALQRRLTPLAAAVTGGFGIAGLKLAMEMAGYAGGEVRGPAAPGEARGARSDRGGSIEELDRVDGDRGSATRPLRR